MIPYLAGLSDSEAQRVAGRLVPLSAAAREMILAEGAASRGFYLLRSGRARVFRTGQDGREQVLRLVSPGETFGEVPMFDGGAAPSNVEALEPSQILLVPAAAIHQLIEEHPAVAMAMLGHLARRLRAMTEMVQQISLQTVSSRLARHLYLLAREEGVAGPEGVVVARSITVQDLASLVGSVREVVSRNLKAMQDEGTVEVKRREFVIRDIEALRRLI
jgi:CRP/FNR family transcriptional regulator